MKLLKQSLAKDSSGTVSIIPEDKEDIWALYNLIAKDDEIALKTIRNVKVSSNSSSTTRKLLTLHLKVETVDFTPSEATMRIKARTVEQHDDVPLGSYHTAEIELHQKLTINKADWDDIALDIINKACSIDEKAEVGAVILEEGVGHVCLLTDNMTVIKAKVEKSIPRKRRGDSSAHDKALNRFLDMIVSSALRNLEVAKLKAIIIVSPGFLGRQVADKINEEALKEGDKDLIRAKSKFIIAHSSTGYLQGLEEAMKTPELKKQLADTKVQRNVALFDEFSKLLNDDEGKSWYGDVEVEKAVDMGGAVKVLMITDSLFKSDNIQKRKHYIKLTEKVREDGGEVSIFSSLHDSGEQLNQLTGIAVILNYPVLNLDEDDE